MRRAGRPLSPDRAAWCVALVLMLGCAGGSDDVVTPEELRSIFVRRSVCQGIALPPALLRVVANADGVSAMSSEELACGRSAASCEAFLACSEIDPSGACDPATTPVRCDGDVLASCDPSGYPRRVSCAGRDGNLTCVTDTSGISRCGLGSCEAAGGLACVDGYVESCNGGVRTRADDCTASDRTCVTDGSRAACVDRAEACERDECDGDVLLDCVSSGLGSIETDCAARLAGGRCARVDGAARCIADDAACADAEPTCVGSVITACVDQERVEVDCAVFLGATCVAEADGVRCVSASWP